MSEDELQKLFDRSLKIAIKNMDECLRHVARAHAYEDRLSLLLNPFVEEKILSQDKEGVLKPLVEKLKEEQKVLAAQTQNREFWIRYGSIPIVVAGSFFITGGVGALFFLGGMLALDAGEYYYVYVQDHENLKTQFQNLMVNLPESDARFGSFSTFDQLRRELYGFANPEGFFETLESFGTTNWLKFSLVMDGLVLLRPIKLTQYILRQKYHKLHELGRLMESSPELQKVMGSEEGMSYLRRFLETLPHADMPEDLIRAIDKISEKLPRAERAAIEIRASRSGYEVLSISRSADFLKKNGVEGSAILEGVYNKLRKVLGLSEEAFQEFLQKEGIELFDICKMKKGRSLKLKTPHLEFGPNIEYRPYVRIVGVNEEKLQKLLRLSGEEGLRVKPDLVRKVLLSETLPRLQKTHPDQIFQDAFSIIREVLESGKSF